MSRWASGIAVVTTLRDGGIHGMTVTSFCSLAAEPPLVMVSIDRLTRSHAHILEQQVFGVNILAEGQEELSDLCAGFAGEAGNWLEGVAHRFERTGAPVLELCAAWLDCRLRAAHEAGDHTLFVGAIEAAGAADRPPLLWHRRGFRRLAVE